ncbi:hypothetical protein F4861DRAFT_543176 [Xylaria intraflava]|nr:hypothetical protein F4861DRAFT_543176 [Xylaria intraflava]
MSSRASQAELELLARQLIRFHDSRHSNTTLIAQNHLDFAHHLVRHAPQPPLDLLPFPLEWAESTSRFRRFLTGWSVRHHIYQPDASEEAGASLLEEAANVPLPVTPPSQQIRLDISVGPPSVGHSRAAVTKWPPSEGESTTDSTIRQLGDLSIHSSPSVGNPPTPSARHAAPSIVRHFATRTDRAHAQPQATSSTVTTPEIPRTQSQNHVAATPDAMALTPEAAANLIAAAFERQNANIAEVVALTMQQIQAAGTHPPAGSGSLKAEEVGFFNPSLRDTDGSGTVTHGKQTIYTDIWAFTARLKHLTSVHGWPKVQTVWTTCLQAMALQWHSTELTDEERMTYASTPDVELVTTALEKRFKKSHADALSAIQTSSFTMRDVARGQQLRVFIQRVIRDGKSCGYSEHNQLMAAFQAMDPDIRTLLRKPSEATTTAQFLANVDEQESTIVDKAHGLYPSHSNRTYQSQAQPVQAYYGAQQSQYRPSYSFPNSQNHRNKFADNSNRQQRGSFNRPQNDNPNPDPQASPAPMTNLQDVYSPYFNGQPAQSRNWTPGRQPANATGSGSYGGQWRDNRAGNGRNGSSRSYSRNNNRNNWNNSWRNGTNPLRNAAFLGTDGHDRAPYVGGSFPQEEYDECQGYFQHVQDQADAGDFAAVGQFDEPCEDIISSGPIPADFGPPDLDDEQPIHDAAQFCHQIPRASSYTCTSCLKEFASNNRLHRHIRESHSTPEIRVNVAVAHDLFPAHHADPRLSLSHVMGSTETQAKRPVAIFDRPKRTGVTGLPIILSSVDSRPEVGTGFSYTPRTYLHMYIMPSPVSEKQMAVAGDTGCTRTIGDREWVLLQWPGAEVRTRAVPMIIRGIANDEHTTDEYVIVPLYFKGIRDGTPVVASFVREVTLVRGLQARMLIGMDILDEEQIDIILSRKIAVIQSCKVSIPISCTPKPTRKPVNVRVATDTRVAPRSYAMIATTKDACVAQDCVFEPISNLISVYATIADGASNKFPVRNDTDHEVLLPRRHRLGYLAPMEPDARADPVLSPELVDDAQELALHQPDRHEPKAERQLLGQLRDFTTSGEHTVKHPSGVTIFKHSNPRVTRALYDLITEFAEVFQDTGFADVAEEDRPRFHLHPGWEKRLRHKCKLYQVNDEDNCHGVNNSTNETGFKQMGVFWQE